MGSPVGPSADKVNYFIQKNSRNWHWLWSPNGASTSVVGIRLAQKLGDGWELIGVAETGFNPYSFSLINGPRSIADNNLLALSSQKTQYDTSRAGQWDNSQGFFGVSNPKYGTLTFGRTNTLSQSAIGAFDPVASVAFSQLGFSAVYAGFGAGPTNRINTAVTYRLTYQGFRFAAQTQVGGYDQGNAATGAYQLQVGTDIGKLAFDAIGGFARNAVTLSSFSGVAIPPGFDPNAILRGTLSNTGGIALLTRYNWDPFKFYLGYIYSLTTNPSDDFAGGLPTIASGISVPAGFVTSNQFNVPRVLNTVWTGARYAVRPNIDLAAGVYYEHQNDFLPAPSVCKGSGIATSSTRCAGDRWSYSFMIDYRPVSRVSLYAWHNAVECIRRASEWVPAQPERRPDRRHSFSLLSFSVGIAANAAPVAVIGIAARSVRIPLAFWIRPQKRLGGCRSRGHDVGRLMSGQSILGRATCQCDGDGAQEKQSRRDCYFS